MKTSVWELTPCRQSYSYFENFPFFRKGNDYFDKYAIYIVEKGSFEYRIGNGVSEIVSEGELVICPPETNFYKSVVKAVTMHLVCIDFDERAAIAGGKYSFTENTRISQTLGYLKGLVSQMSKPTEDYRCHLVNDLWYSVCAMVDFPFVKYEEKTADSFFKEMTDFIEKNPSTTLEELSREFSVSRVTVNKRFQKCTGDTAGRYITNFRIEKACRLIATTDEAFKTIAPECGFSNEYYFSTVFTAQTGYTPGEYRKMIKK